MSTNRLLDFQPRGVQLFLVFEAASNNLREIHARTERAARSIKYNDPGFARRVERLQERLAGGLVECVAFVRPVQCDARNSRLYLRRRNGEFITVLVHSPVHRMLHFIVRQLLSKVYDFNVTRGVGLR